MWVALIQLRETMVEERIRLCPSDNTPTPIRNEAEPKYVPLRSLIECQRGVEQCQGVKMKVLVALNPFTLLWEDRI